MARCVLVALSVIAALLGATAVASASNPPQVICAVTYEPHATGAYRTRPHKCIFHKRGAPVDYADTVGTSHLHWLHWGQDSAIAKGKAAENMVGLVPVKVKLMRPIWVCGHTVFSQARFKFPRTGGGYGRPLPLDTRLSGCS